MIVMVDDEFRENEGDLVVAAEKVTPESINFMMRNACGLVCLAMAPDICERLGLEPLPGSNVDAHATPFTPYIDARTCITTGTSAFDRARGQFRWPSTTAPTPGDLIRGAKGTFPGSRHAKAACWCGQGILKEASTCAACASVLKEAAVICEVVNPDEPHGPHMPDLVEFCRQDQLKMCTIEQIIKYRRQREKLIKREVALLICPLQDDAWRIRLGSPTAPSSIQSRTWRLRWAALVGKLAGRVPLVEEPVLESAAHSECLTGDVFAEA